LPITKHPTIRKDRAGVFRRALGDGEHAEITIRERVYRVGVAELT
jgi:hypothetical protein